MVRGYSHWIRSRRSAYKRVSLTRKGERRECESESILCRGSTAHIVSAMRLFFLVAVWLACSTVVYVLLVRSVLAHVHSVFVHIGVGVVCAAVLSPGAAVGHGVVPFPGGLMCLRMLFAEEPYWRGTLFNVVFWALTAAIFIALTLRLRQQP